MSKTDELRAMREAKYARARAATGRAPLAKTAAKTDAPVAPKKAAKPAVDQPAAETEALCGHKNMSGRTCTREQGHAAKSHRYS